MTFTTRITNPFLSNSKVFPSYGSFYDRDFPVYTMPRYLPPTLVGNAVITSSVIGDGCILNVSENMAICISSNSCVLLSSL